MDLVAVVERHCAENMASPRKGRQRKKQQREELDTPNPRASNWENLWDKDLSAGGFTGFLAPRDADGSFNLTDYSVTNCSSACYWAFDTVSDHCSIPFECFY